MSLDATAIVRLRIVQRLDQLQMTPEGVAIVMGLVDEIMGAQRPLAHVLMAAVEVCEVLQLTRTRQAAGAALATLLDELNEDTCKQAAQGP